MSRAKVGHLLAEHRPLSLPDAARFSNSHCLLGLAEDGTAHIEQLRARVRIAAGRLLRSILPRIEHVEVDQVAELQPAIERQASRPSGIVEARSGIDS